MLHPLHWLLFFLNTVVIHGRRSFSLCSCASCGTSSSFLSSLCSLLCTALRAREVKDGAELLLSPSPPTAVREGGVYVHRIVGSSGGVVASLFCLSFLPSLSIHPYYISPSVRASSQRASVLSVFLTSSCSSPRFLSRAPSPVSFTSSCSGLITQGSSPTPASLFSVLPGPVSLSSSSSPLGSIHSAYSIFISLERGVTPHCHHHHHLLLLFLSCLSCASISSFFSPSNRSRCL